MSENPQKNENRNTTPRFYLRIEESGKIVLSFKNTDPWLHGVLWRAFKARFLRGMKEKNNGGFSPDDFDFLRSAVLQMLLAAEKHYQQSADGEFVLRAAATGNMFDLRDTMRAIVRDIVDNTK